MSAFKENGPPEFFYFDMGNVLLLFDHGLACQQLAEISGITPERVAEIIFHEDVDGRYDRGEISSQEFYDIFCQQAGAKPGYDELMLAASEIFQVNATIVPIVAHLHAAGYRTGILSNTCDAHWNYIRARNYAVIENYFSVYVMSFQVRSRKPDAEIYQTAAKMAGVEPSAIFFVDDRLDNVEAAKEAGFDAVQFTTVNELAHQLRQRNVVCNL